MTQNERTNLFFREAARYAHTLYNSDGDWIAAGPPLVVRERYWLSFALYAQGEVAFADAIVRRGDVTVTHLGVPRTDGSTFDIFHSNIAAVLLKRYEPVMAADVRQKLSDIVIDAIKPGGGDRDPCFMFHGYNDNMPAKAAMGMILGGELLGDAGAVAHGISNLRGLRAMLVRRGTISEYNSPTYSAVTVHALGEIAEHAQNEEAREIALLAEQRLWIDLAARFHPEIGALVGPHSRAYTIDLLSNITCVSSLLWFVLGDVVKASPMNLFADDPELVIHHMGDYPFNIAQMCWFAAGTYHIPGAASTLFEHKSYPFSAVATYESGDRGPDFPAQSGAIKSYLQKDYAIGTSSAGWLDSTPTAPYMATYKQREDVTSYRDIGTAFTKILVNDNEPGLVPPTACNSRGEEDDLRSRAIPIAVQSEAAALVLTSPHVSLGGGPDSPVAVPEPLHRLSEVVCFPSHFHSADELIVGGKARAGWGGSAQKGEWIVCRRGRMMIGMLPIAYSREFGLAPISLERVNKYEVIRVTFYEGEARFFSRDQLRYTFGGFVAEHASVDEYATLADFAASLEAGIVSDFAYTTRRTRYTRPASENRPALDLEASWSPAAPTTRFVSINGRVAGGERVIIDGIAERDLPFLGEPIDPTATVQTPYGPFACAW